jgi:hypothetical protein
MVSAGDGEMAQVDGVGGEGEGGGDKGRDKWGEFEEEEIALNK